MSIDLRVLLAAAYAPTQTDLSAVVRPRTTPVLTPFVTTELAFASMR
ncbi:MAG: hypothetical protein U0X20_29435 [Caldilineaceae bacterium]